MLPFVQDFIPEGHADGAFDEVNPRQKHHRTDEVEVQMDHRAALGPLDAPTAATIGGEGGADVGAQNDGGRRCPR